MRGLFAPLVMSLLVVAASAMPMTATESPNAVPGPRSAFPPTTIYELPSLIESLDLPAGVERSLLAKAEGAIRAYESGWPDEIGVASHLEALAREVRALTGKRISVPSALAVDAFLRDLLVTLGTPIITCALPGDVSFSTTIEECDAAGGVVQECVPPMRDQGAGEGEAKGKGLIKMLNYTETDVLGPMSGWVTNLTNSVAASGVTNGTYARGSYTCVNFASDLQAYLNAHGYTTSFTVIYKKDAKTGKIATGHAIVDVKASDGTVLFVEPQDGSNPDLDFDHDGLVEVATGHPSGPTSGWPMTDDNARIEVYADRQAARQAGCPV